MQRGSLKKFFDNRKRAWRWRFQWREKGFKGPRTKDLGACSEVSRADARRAADRIIEQVQGYVPAVRFSNVSLKKFIEEQYLAVKTRRWKASTRGTTEQIIRDHIVTPFGEQGLNEITWEQLQSHLDRLAEGGKSYSLVDHVRWQLVAIFKMALTKHLVRENPADKQFLTTPIRKTAGEKLTLNPDEFRRGLLYLEIRERLIFLLAVVEGLRPGEIIGLRRGDISKEGLCAIRRRMYRRVEDVPKSDRGTREFPLADITRRALDEYLSVTPRSDHHPDWLFPSENPAKPIDYANVFRRRIRPALEKVGLRSVNFQVMRRTSATELGIVEPDARVRADMLGHSVDVHENEYRQAPLEAKRRAKKLLGERLQ